MPGAEGGGNAEMLVKRYKLQILIWISSRDLSYSIVTIVNNIIYMEVVKIIDLTYSQTTDTHKW